MSDEDIDIIIGCRKNDRKSQLRLLEKYAGYLLAVIKRYCSRSNAAHDVLQETWIQIFNSLDQYEERGLLKGWMARIAISKCYKEYRKDSRLDYFKDLPDSVDYSPDAIDQLQYDDLMKLVNTISRPKRDVFVMNIIDGLNHEEIGAILKIKESTSRAHLSNARKELRALLSTSAFIL